MIREQNIKSGKMFEAKFYPIYDYGRRLPTGKKKGTSKAQKKLNEKHAIEKLIRLVNANFDTGDLFIHMTYDQIHMPNSIEGVKKDIVNYNRRIKNYRARSGLPPNKYIYIIETTISRKTGQISFHVHMFMSKMDRNIAEDMWGNGTMVNADRFQPDKFGQEAAARYVSKDPQGKKRWGQSKNLKKPIYRPPKDGKTSKRKVDRMATQHIDDAGYWERRYKGYRFISCEAEWNEYNSNWYLHITMRKKE